MEKEMSLEDAMATTIATMRRVDDLGDTANVASFMNLLDVIVESPREILELENPFRLSILLTALVSRGFAKNYPRYYNYNVGQVACSASFYCFMKQQSEVQRIPGYNYQTVIFLLHEGREYLADIAEAALLARMSPYNPLNLWEYKNSGTKKDATVKGIEMMMHITYNAAGFSDNSFDRWKRELESEIEEIKELAGTDFLMYAKEIYKYMDGKLRSSRPFDFDE